MDSSIFSVLIISAYAIYFMLPAYLSNVSALIFGGGTPIDFKRNFWDGNRIFGDGKTWRGMIIGTLVGSVIGIILSQVSPHIIHALITYNPIDSNYYNILPVTITQGALLGCFMGAGALIGDACGSFIKRRLNIGRGKPAPLLDQLDLVIGALIFASLVVTIPFNLIIVIVIITVFLHLGSNIIAYLLGMKNVWY